jgi:uncharacterized protein (TIGR04255 family)
VPKLRRPPLVHVLAHIGFSPVVALKDQLAPLQTVFKDLGYPRFSQSEVPNITIVSGTAPSIQMKWRWDFLDREKTSGIVMTEQSLVLLTTAYTTFSAFSAELEHALRAIEPMTQRTVMDRIGLRYVDHVRPRQFEHVEEYVSAELLGFTFQRVPLPEGGSRAFRVESLAQSALGTLAVRCFRLPAGQALPPDLWPSPLEFPGHATAGDVVALDFDHFAQPSIDFDVLRILQTTADLQETASSAFKSAVTELALKRWNEDGVDR